MKFSQHTRRRRRQSLYYDRSSRGSPRPARLLVTVDTRTHTRTRALIILMKYIYINNNKIHLFNIHMCICV